MKTVLITGASTGIGRATAELFQQRGWQVAATMRTPEKAGELAQRANVAAIRLDVTDAESIRQAIDETLARFQAIDVVVNNAGYGLVGPFEATAPEQVARQFDTNVFGLMSVVRALLPHFRARRQGVIVNISSIGGRVTFPLYSLYHATKWAVEGFSESLQHELVPFDIRVKLIEPGAIKTDFYDRSMDVVRKPELTAYDSYVAKAMGNMQGAGETGAPPSAVAEIIYGAATDDSWKLRYPAAGGARSLLTLRKILPDSIFNGIIRRVVMR